MCYCNGCTEPTELGFKLGLVEIHPTIISCLKVYFDPRFAGKHDGSFKGVRYFVAGKRRGRFVRPDKVVLDRNRRGSGSRSSGSRMTQSLTTSSLSAMAAGGPDTFKMPRSSSRGKLVYCLLLE